MVVTAPAGRTRDGTQPSTAEMSTGAEELTDGSGDAVDGIDAAVEEGITALPVDEEDEKRAGQPLSHFCVADGQQLIPAPHQGTATPHREVT